MPVCGSGRISMLYQVVSARLVHLPAADRHEASRYAASSALKLRVSFEGVVEPGDAAIRKQETRAALRKVGP